MEKRYSIKEFSELIGISIHTVKDWVRKDKVKHYQYVENGKIYIPESELTKRGFKVGWPNKVVYSGYDFNNVYNCAFSFYGTVYALAKSCLKWYNITKEELWINY